MATTLKVNGQSHTVDVPAEMPLLWVLRDVLDLKGTKFGCGISQCGACTVHVNGTAVRSCTRRVGTVANMEVTTVEGLSPEGTTALQRAWEELDVPQCGYCQPGFVLAAASVIAADPKQTSEQVLSQLTNLCRCGTYDAIRLAVGYAVASIQGGPAPEKGAAR